MPCVGMSAVAVLAVVVPPVVRCGVLCAAVPCVAVLPWPDVLTPLVPLLLSPFET